MLLRFQQRCDDCGKFWNAAVGTAEVAIIAEEPTNCPRCKSGNIGRFAEGWETGPVIGLREINADKA